MTPGQKLSCVGVVVGLFGLGNALAAADPAVETVIQHLQDGLQPRVRIQGEKPVLAPLAKRMQELHVPGVSIAVIRHGSIEWARGFGVKEIGGAPVTPDTLFQAASISKPVFALGVLRLVEQGKLDLDADVNSYLKSWKLPQNDFTRTYKVTLREILSHTAGLTVHGFAGYASGAPVPTVPQILDGTAPANSPAIRVDTVPTTIYRYSGGGYVLAQQLLLDVTGIPTAKYMHDTVLAPLGMTHSTYEQPLPAKRLNEVALPYNASGAPIKGGPHVYPEMAPAGLWTTPTDLARYAIAVQQMLADKSKGLISASMARTMVTPVLGEHGLGPTAGGSPENLFFAHSGGNEGYRCNLFAYENGDGVVIMTNSDNGGVIVPEILRTLAVEYGWKPLAPAERSIAKVPAPQLDRYVGAYIAADRQPLVLRRDGERLIGGTKGSVDREWLPLSDHELFARDVDIVLTFMFDDVGRVKGAVWNERTADFLFAFTRLTDARARPVIAEAAALAKHVKDQTPFPGSDAAARRLMTGLASGQPDYASMSPLLARLTREQLPDLQATVKSFGALKSLTFTGVGPGGADRFDVLFENNTVELSVQMLPDGRIDTAGFTPK